MREIRTRYLAAFVLLAIAVMLPIVVRSLMRFDSPSIEIVLPSGEIRKVRFVDLEQLPQLERRGTYQNQFSNWRDEGLYRGPRLSEILDGTEYDAAVVIAGDGYRVEIPRTRVDDPEYPMVLALSFDGREPPAWADGPRIAVLPEDGNVSNAEYDAVSAGSFWVKNVARIVLESSD